MNTSLHETWFWGGEKKGKGLGLFFFLIIYRRVVGRYCIILIPVSSITLLSVLLYLNAFTQSVVLLTSLICRPFASTSNTCFVISLGLRFLQNAAWGFALLIAVAVFVCENGNDP